MSGSITTTYLLLEACSTVYTLPLACSGPVAPAPACLGWFERQRGLIQQRILTHLPPDQASIATALMIGEYRGMPHA